MNAMTATGTASAERLLTSEQSLEITPDELCDAVVDFLRSPPDFQHGPFIYSIGVMERAPDGKPSDPSYLYHRELYEAGEPTRREMIQALVNVAAALDVSLCGHNGKAEHKILRVKVPSR
jgi:hypothetical protein